ncbi:probable G-protein coupled receptor B0563.6 isoform X2 [Drosophila rhopaloa]|uniref:Probable G-protein coupled receptor B0563.6 isoform X2 n=1 Tax=Drosophila rhopaloa TaxID=1041015 RepID=A0A6P4ET12_DRORH|nr:probable G-protein coupled receptor B0563.6 isoform X2 [Drosophila rhopaloa]
MITRLYNTEEDPAYCSFIWGANLTSSADVLANATSVFNTDLRDDFYRDVEDPRTESLREYCYGLVLPIICAMGIIGNVFNLIVLTRRNMRGTAYIYMRAYSTAALLAIVFAIPFGIRMLVHKDRGQWEEFGPAFYTAHLELYLGNGCLGVGVMMLLVLTIERYVSVCHPGFARPVMGPPGVVVFFTCLATVIVYLPSIFRGELIKCIFGSSDAFVYLRRDNTIYQQTIFYRVYKIMLEVIFKLVPTLVIGGLNMRIMMVYRRTCERRRQMVLSRPHAHAHGHGHAHGQGHGHSHGYLKDDDPRKFAEERRLFLLLGSTSILFLVCVSPMAILHMTIASEVYPSFPFQVFRASANLLELINYSLTFYIYCLFSEDFRNTLVRTIKWPWLKGKCCHQAEHENTRNGPSGLPMACFTKVDKGRHKHHITTTSGLGRSSSI